MSEIIPAILPKNEEDLRKKISDLPPEINYFHLDILEQQDVWIDGIKQNFEVHLMVEKPEVIIKTWVERGAKRIIIHSLGGETAKSGAEIGLGVEVGIPLETIFPLIPKVNFVHLMSIDALGTQGDDFEPIIFDRIKKVKEKFPQMLISVDGGINTDNYQALEGVGADRLVVGSGFKNLWNSLTKK